MHPWILYHLATAGIWTAILIYCQRVEPFPPDQYNHINVFFSILAAPILLPIVMLASIVLRVAEGNSKTPGGPDDRL
jgi:hypothetical protein